MKVTLIRTDKKNVPHVTTSTIEKLITRIQTDTKQQTVQDLRRHLPMLVSLGWQFKDMHLLPRVYPAVELTKASNGDLAFKNWNGLVLLTIGGPQWTRLSRRKYPGGTVAHLPTGLEQEHLHPVAVAAGVAVGLYQPA